uniref:Uncharacterized protein n=1 Tax=Anguilla anguilla TaxID=7936 RepID=A0A0E9RBC1_ANGAN
MVSGWGLGNSPGYHK